MNRKSKINVWSLALLGAALVLAVVAGRAQSNPAPAQGQTGGTQAAPAAAVKKAPEQFKNIQVLKDLDADKLQPAMQFIAASLGVECNFCHVQENGPDGRPRTVYEKDDKREKGTARKMMQMTMDLNKNSFNGNRQITCDTCHRGSSSPVSVPAVLEAEGERPQPPANAAPPAAPPNADKILANYLDALGGADAVAKITTRVEKGNVLVGTSSTPYDVYMKAPNKRVSFSHGPNGDSITAFDGTAGWMGGGRGGPRDMQATDSMSAMVDAAVAFPASLKTVFPQMRAGRPDKIGDKDVYVLTGRGPGAPLTRLYFDEQTGLLVRVVRLNDAGLGFMPVQVDYSDYRAVDGVKIPFHWTLSRPGGRFSIQIDSAQQNVPIDDSKFMKPAAPAPAGNPPGQR
ncbi:MAG TPA: c-type cytochrome [Candidatus Acidoferrum sp.]|nr:c-type cytochrome [Candidatus Acidoferrum sp.]